MAVSTAKEKYGLINTSVNCAGINVSKTTISDDGELHSLDLFEKAIKVMVYVCYVVIGWIPILASVEPIRMHTINQSECSNQPIMVLHGMYQ